MSRTAQGLVGLVLFLGLGATARYYFPIWLEGKLKESQEAMDKDMANWKPVQTSFDGVKFDKPLQLTPTIDMSQFNRPPVTVQPPVIVNQPRAVPAPRRR